MPNGYGSKINLLDDENCEGTKTTSNSAAESKHISICLDTEEFNVSFENGMLSKYSCDTLTFDIWLCTLLINLS